MATSGRISNIIHSFPVDSIQYYHKLALDYGILDVTLHPYDYADTLIRLGYEPFPPVEQSHMFSSPSLTLPGINSYVYYLYSVEGFGGLFRSVIPYTASALIYRHLTNYINDLSPLSLERLEDEPRLCAEFTRRNVIHFIRSRAWKMTSSILALHISHPLYVIAVRTMARFVTADTTKEGYRPILVDDSWIKEIGKITRFAELYDGFTAKLLREVAFAVVSAGAFLAFMKFLQIIQVDVTQADPIENAIEYIGNNIGAMYSTPCGNTSDIMIAQGGDIPLGRAPFTEQYKTCMDCLFRLSAYRKWKNSGSGGLFQGRTYKGAMERVDGKLHPIGELFGPVYLPWYAHDLSETPHFLSEHYNAWKDLGVLPGVGLSTLEQIFLKGRGSNSGFGGERRPSVLNYDKPPSFITGNFMTTGYLTSNPFKL